MTSFPIGNVKIIECYKVVNFEVDSYNSFQDIPKNHFVAAKADIEDSIKRKRFRVSLKTGTSKATKDYTGATKQSH